MTIKKLMQVLCKNPIPLHITQADGPVKIQNQKDYCKYN